MWIEITTFREVEIEQAIDRDRLELLTTKPWRVFHRGRWWLAFGPAVIGAVVPVDGKTARYTVFRTKARPTKSMKPPVGGVWDVTRAIPQMDDANQVTSLKMSDYLKDQAGHNAAIELMFDKTPRVEELGAYFDATRAEMATVPNIADHVSRLLGQKIENKISEMKAQGMRVEIVGHPEITSSQNPANDLTSFYIKQKVRVKQ